MSDSFVKKSMDAVLHPKTPEIQTPEDMFSHLKNKVDKNFLKKMEAISSEAKKNSKNEWEELREKLTDEEKKTIKKECPDVAGKLEKTDASPEKKEGMTAGAKAATALAAVGGAGVLAAVVGKENAEKLEKAEGFFGKIEGFFEKIGGFFNRMIEWIQAMIVVKFPAIAKLFGIEMPDSVAKGEVVKDKAKEISEKVSEKVAEEFEKKFHLDPKAKTNTWKTKRDALLGIIKTRSKELSENFFDPDTGEYVVSIGTVMSALSSGSGFLYDCIREDVINPMDITYDLSVTAVGTVRYVARTILGVTVPDDWILAGEADIEKLAEKGSSMSEKERLFVLAIFYRKGGFVSEFLGYAAELFTSPMYLLNPWNVRSMDTLLIPGVERKIRKMDQIIRSLEKIGWPSQEVALLQDMKQAAIKTKEALGYAQHAYANMGNKLIVQEMSQKISSIATELKPFGLRWENQLIGWQLRLDIWNKRFLGDIVKNRYSEYIHSLVDCLDPNKIQAFAKVRNHIKFREIPWTFNSTVMHFENPKTFRAFANEVRLMASRSPAWIREFIGLAPVFIIGHTISSAVLQEDANMKDAVKDLRYFIPIVWPICMMSGAELRGTSFSEITLKDGGMFALGALLLGIDGYFGMKAFTAEGVVWMGKYMIKPVTDFGRAVKFMSSTLGGMTRLLVDAERVLTKAERIPRVGYAAMILLAILGGVYYTRQTFEKDGIEDLRKKEILTKDGSLNTEKLRQEMVKYSPEEKKRMFDLMFGQDVSRYFGENATFGGTTELEGDVFTIFPENKKEKSILKEALLSSDLYRVMEDLGIECKIV